MQPSPVNNKPGEKRLHLVLVLLLILYALAFASITDPDGAPVPCPLSHPGVWPRDCPEAAP